MQLVQIAIVYFEKKLGGVSLHCRMDIRQGSATDGPVHPEVFSSIPAARASKI